MSKLNKRYSLLDGDQTYSLKSRISGYWERVLSAAMEVCDHIFNTPVNEHPLILSDQQNIGKTRWKLEEPELSILNILLQYLITNFIDSNMMSKYDVNKLI